MILQEFFEKNNKLALAFSGGVDSAYLLYAGVKYGCDITAYYVKSEFQPEFEFEDAKRLAEELGARLRIINVSALEDVKVRENGPKRCYYCKNRIFSSILKAASEDGYKVIIDGTNASDDVNDRPGMKALKELSVLSPLRMCDLTKAEIRKLSKEAGLFTWDKPAYACLATRIPTGTIICAEDLKITENAEAALMEMGYSDFRIRKAGSTAKIQLNEKQLDKLFNERNQVLEILKAHYESVTLDLEVR